MEFCPRCDRPFETRALLDAHIQRHIDHDGVELPSYELPETD